MAKMGYRLAAAFLAVVLAVGFVPMPGARTAYAGTDADSSTGVMLTAGTLAADANTGSGELLSGDALNGLKVRIRPTGSYKPLSINEDGSGKQNCVHLYYQGKSCCPHFELSGRKTAHMYRAGSQGAHDVL